jgi:feruloyl esterase
MGRASAYAFGALNQGYATAWTDTGHTVATGAFALENPEKVVDFAYRAVHETAVKSKGIIAAYYGKMPALSYFDGCSTGGRPRVAGNRIR